jgi:hypothetical protein
LFIHSSVDEQLGSLHFLAIVNIAAANIVQKVFSGHMFPIPLAIAPE